MMKAQRHRLSSDIISNLPADIIETILCFLPIQDAARTSILSRDWRYKWTKISKLVFNENNFQLSTSQWVNMYQVLLQHQGPITEFTLSALTEDRYVGIEQMMLHLSRRNTVKKLRLSYLYKLPLSVLLSFHKLTDLYLRDCYIPHQPTIFNGFASLTTLHLEIVDISNKTLLRLLSNCPLLKSFTLLAYYNVYCDEDSSSSFIELFECLRVIEDLTICHRSIECFRLCPHPQPRDQLPTSLLHIKYVCLKSIVIEKDGYGLPFLVLLIRSSPNLEKIKLEMVTPEHPYDKLEIDSYAMMDCSDIKLEHLIELEIEYFGNLKSELEFVKIILAKSPMLKKVRIIFNEKVANDEELKMSRLLLRFPCASPTIKIIVEKL